MKPLRILALSFALQACGGRASVTAPQGFGSLSVSVNPACAGGETIQLWVDDAPSSGNVMVSLAAPFMVPNLVAGQHGILVYRYRYGTETGTRVTVRTGAITVARLDCPDGMTIITPP